MPWLIRIAARAHRPVVEWGVMRPRSVASIALVLLAGGGFLLVRAGMEFIPQLDEGDLILQTTRASDVRLESAVEDATRMEAALLEHVPEVRRVVSRIGSPAVATDLMGLEQADVFVALAPREEHRPGLTREALIAEIAAVMEEHDPGADVDFTQPIQMRFNELLAGSVSDVTVTLFGSDLTELRALAERTEGIVETVEGATDVRISAPPAVSLVELRPDRLHAAHAGLDSEDVVSAVQALRYGVPVGATFDGPITVPLRLFLAGGESVQGLSTVLVPGQGGRLVPLARIASAEHLEAPGAVEHTNGERRITIGFNVRGADLGSVISSLRARLERELDAPEGIRIVLGGQYENMEAAYARLSLVVPTVLLMIVGLLTFMFRSLRAALAIFLNVPFAGVGGIVALTLRDMPLSVSASIGFIALSGIAVLNGVVLMTRVLALESTGHVPREAARLASIERMRPVLMTAGVAALGFVPM
ncbi:MAG: efflux RND transporter permease subunit, partial [Polyangiaceae bacterium]|nr:efflux RND transporter permease subunit [Polyangiaceae bacterium]